jgi:hypothetical protein
MGPPRRKAEHTRQTTANLSVPSVIVHLHGADAPYKKATGREMVTGKQVTKKV